jgi:hypothetical protein
MVKAGLNAGRARLLSSPLLTSAWRGRSFARPGGGAVVSPEDERRK